MSIAERVRRYAGTLLGGFAAAFLIASIAGNIWPGAFWIVFLSLAGFWLLGAMGVAVREFRSRDAAVFEDPVHWHAEELPQEFRFITRRTTLAEVSDRLGPFSPVADTGMVRYDLPSGGAVFIYFDPSSADESTVQGIQLYTSADCVPFFPL